MQPLRAFMRHDRSKELNEIPRPAALYSLAWHWEAKRCSLTVIWKEREKKLLAQGTTFFSEGPRKSWSSGQPRNALVSVFHSRKLGVAREEAAYTIEIHKSFQSLFSLSFFSEPWIFMRAVTLCKPQGGRRRRENKENGELVARPGKKLFPNIPVTDVKEGERSSECQEILLWETSSFPLNSACLSPFNS